MTMPALPPNGNTNWGGWGGAVHDAATQVVEGRLTDASLRADFAAPDQTNTFSEDQEFAERVGARRLRIGGTGTSSDVGLILTDTASADFFDNSRRLGYVFSAREQVNAGSLFLVTLKKAGPNLTDLFAAEFEVHTSETVSGATAARLTGAQGLVRHRADVSLPFGSGLGAVVQVDSAANAKITRAHGLYIYKPEKFAGGDVDDYYGIYVAGTSDTIGDAGATALTPRRWYGLYINRGASQAESDSRARSIWAIGRATFVGPGVGGVTFGVRQETDTIDRTVIADDGSFQFGSGSAAVDAFLSRRAAKVIETGGTAFRPGNFPTGSLPSASTAGSGAIAWDTTTSQLKVSDGAVWKVATLT